MLLKGQRSRLRDVCILCILFLGGQVYGASAADESCNAARVSNYSYIGLPEGKSCKGLSSLTAFTSCEPAPELELCRMKVALEIYSDGIEMEVFFAVPSPLGVLPADHRVEAIPLLVADPEDACSPLSSKHLTGRQMQMYNTVMITSPVQACPKCPACWRPDFSFCMYPVFHQRLYSCDEHAWYRCCGASEARRLHIFGKGSGCWCCKCSSPDCV